MENAPASFDFQEKSVRTITNPDGTIWFVARDVCEALEISWMGKKTLASIPEIWCQVGSFPTRQKNQHGESGVTEKDVILINEPALYKLAFRSNKPAAEEFTNWVVSEVLPAIRKTGRFSVTAPALATEAPDREDPIRLARKLVT